MAYSEPASRWLEVALGVVLVVGATGLARFALLGRPSVIIGDADASGSIGWRMAAFATAAMAVLVAFRLFSGDGRLLAPFVLYAGAGVFALMDLVSVVLAVLYSPFFFGHGITAFAMAVAAWQVAAHRRPRATPERESLTSESTRRPQRP